MIKSNLIDRLAEKVHHLSLHEVITGVDTILETLSDNLSRGMRVEIRGFGSFSPRYAAARKAHNPKTGKRLMTAAKYRPHFKHGKELSFLQKFH
jgi:integration host factor subunit beta